jgi:hypothetical protein
MFYATAMSISKKNICLPLENLHFDHTTNMPVGKALTSPVMERFLFNKTEWRLF